MSALSLMPSPVRFPDSYLINCAHRAAYRLPFIFAVNSFIVRSSAFADAETTRFTDEKITTQRFQRTEDSFSKQLIAVRARGSISRNSRSFAAVGVRWRDVTKILTRENQRRYLSLRVN